MMLKIYINLLSISNVETFLPSSTTFSDLFILY